MSHLQAGVVALVIAGSLLGAPTTAQECPQPVGVHVNTCPGVSDLVVAGDFVFAFAIRSGAETPVPEWRVEQAIADLEGIADPSLSRNLTLSALADFQTHAARIAASGVTAVSYNTEYGMTPAAEINDLPASIVAFADLAHGMGRLASWGPMSAIYDQMDQGGHLPTILPALDRIGLQMQRFLYHQGLPGLMATYEARAATIRGIDPDIAIVVQLGVDLNGVEDCVAGFRALCDQPDAPDAHVPFTPQSVAELREVLTRTRYGDADGDLDGDGDVDLADFEKLIACWTGPQAGPVGSACLAGDADYDGDIDLRDFAAFQACIDPPP